VEHHDLFLQFRDGALIPSHVDFGLDLDLTILANDGAVGLSQMGNT